MPTLTYLTIISLSEKECRQLASRLSLQITEGTNCEEEKASWIRAVAELLGLTQECVPHYLTIIEVPGTDWDCNGITQVA